MKKKYVIGGLAGLLVTLVLTGFGISSCYSRQEVPAAVFAFASDRGGSGDIFILDRAGQIRNLTNNPSGDWDPVWSPDGKMLAFTSHRSGNSDIWLLDLSQETEAPQVRPLTKDPAWDYSPTWSPSGKSVAFVSERDGDPEIFVQHLEADTALQLTFNNEMDRLPAWSPDGKYIAFAAVRNGVEEIHRMWSDGTGEQVITPPSINGTSPAWSPDSQRLAFIGWSDQKQPGIYIIGPQPEQLELLYQADSWLGSLNWSADGQWFTFTAWTAGNHELYALPATGGVPTRITMDKSWDDFMAMHPAADFSPTTIQNVAQAAPAPRSPGKAGFVYGVNMADLGLAYLVNDLGFGWAKSYVNWETVEPEPGKFRWVDPDNIVNAMGDQQLKILMRVHGTPAWARPPGTPLSHPPRNSSDFGRFLSELASRYKGQVAAYEIWNEPNLNYEWGYRMPNPAAYTELLKAAYTAIKQVDPEAIVVSGGLATTGQGSPTAYGDLDFLEGMYQAGARGYFDALGSHPYAYGRAPDETDPYGLSLARVTEQRQVMLANGDETPIWITEVGWVLKTSWDLVEHDEIGVTQREQAEYLARAYAKVPEEWPYVEAMFLFNLDFSTVSWYPAAEPMRWYAILNPDRTPRPAYTLLREALQPD